LSIDFENILLSNDLIIIRNHEDDEEDIGEGFGGVEEQQGRPGHVGVQVEFNFESISESTSRPHYNRQPGHIRDPFWMFYICTKS
jgi:hypothetical protein